MAHRAAHLFFEQDYPGEKRLLVFDDGDRKFDLCDATLETELLYHARTSLPAKRNAMVKRVTDPRAIFIVWDDDDYHGPARIRRQVQALQACPQALACTMEPVLYYDATLRQVWRCTRRFDATVAFRRAFWEACPWDETLDPGSGYRFLHGRAPAALTWIDGGLDYAAVWHGNHRLAQPNLNDAYFTTSPINSFSVEKLLALRCR